MKKTLTTLDNILTGFLIGILIGATLLMGTYTVNKYNEWRHTDIRPIQSELFTSSMDKAACPNAKAIYKNG